MSKDNIIKEDVTPNDNFSNQDIEGDFDINSIREDIIKETNSDDLQDRFDLAEDAAEEEVSFSEEEFFNEDDIKESIENTSILEDETKDFSNIDDNKEDLSNTSDKDANNDELLNEINEDNTELDDDFRIIDIDKNTNADFLALEASTIKSKNKTNKKAIAGICAMLAAILVVVFCPLKIKANPINVIPKGEKLEKHNLDVKLSSLVGLKYNIGSNYKLKGEEISIGPLKTIVNISNKQIEDLEAEYSEPYYEKTDIDKDNLTVTAIFKDGHKEKVSSDDIDIVTKIEDKSTVIHTPYGDTNITTEVIKFKEVASKLKDKVYEGHPVTKDDIECIAIYEDGERIPVENFTIEPIEYAKDTTYLNVYSTYGTSKVEIKPIKMKDAVIPGVHWEGQKYTIEKINAIYEDNISKPLDCEKKNVQFKLGKNSFDVTLKIGTVKAKADAIKKNDAIIAYEKNQEEYKNAYKNYFSGKTYIAITKKTEKKNDKLSKEYLLSHVVVSDPSQIGTNNVSTATKASSISKQNRYVLAINASGFNNNSLLKGIKFENGMTASRDDEVTSGKEVAITKGGSLSYPGKNITTKTLAEKSVYNTIISDGIILIKDSKKQDIKSSERNMQTAIGMTKAGEYYIITAGNNTANTGLTAEELQTIFYDKKCVFAASLDGGSRTSLALNGELINEPLDKKEADCLDFLYITDEVQKEFKKDTNTPFNSSNSNDSSSSNKNVTGQEVVTFAKKYIGKPYVNNGKNLDSGTDGFGFVKAVYQHFGIDIPDTDKVRKTGYGTEIDKQNLKAGDILWYKDHAAIYIGNNQMIHSAVPALSQYIKKSGVQISDIRDIGTRYYIVSTRITK